MRILIIGGGIGGAAAALALERAGFTPIVYEAHPFDSEDVGAFLTLATNGMLALAQLEVPVAELGFPLRTLRMTDHRGCEVSETPLPVWGDASTSYRCLRRAELAAALRAEAIRRGIAVEHGRRLSAAHLDPVGVTACFEDGGSATGELLVGADGLRSTVRAVIDPTASPPRHAGQRVFYGYTHDAPAGARTDPACIEMIRASAGAFGHTTSPDGETFWFARLRGDELGAAEIAATPPSQWREALVARLGADQTSAADIVASTGDELMVTNATDLGTGTRWRNDGMVIIGDAAHAASPATGQGASMALEDAVILAKALRDAPDLLAALAGYERLRRGRVEANVVASAQLSAGPGSASVLDDERFRSARGGAAAGTER